MAHEEWLERAEIYGLSALDGDELIQFEAHLASGCPVCEGHVRETGESLIVIARSLPLLTPPPQVKARLLHQISPEVAPSIRENTRSRWFSWGIGAGAFAAAGLLITMTWSLYATRQELHTLQKDVASIQAGSILHETGIEFLSDPRAQSVHLKGLAPSPGAVGHLLWNPESRKGILITQGLPKNTPDKVYELWAIAGDEPVPMGTFSVEDKPHTLLKIPSLPQGKSFDKFAVTLEPAGGVPKPTGPMHLLGSV
jgi:Anti-sigma-K factor rskA, C-terminal